MMDLRPYAFPHVEILWRLRNALYYHYPRSWYILLNCTSEGLGSMRSLKKRKKVPKIDLKSVQRIEPMLALVHFTETIRNFWSKRVWSQWTHSCDWGVYVWNVPENVQPKETPFRPLKFPKSHNFGRKWKENRDLTSQKHILQGSRLHFLLSCRQKKLVFQKSTSCSIEKKIDS